LKALKRVAKVTGLDRKGASLNLDGGFDARHNRKAIFHAGLMPNIKENQRNRKAPQRGRKRLVDAAMHAFRERVERTFAWEDKCKRLLRRFEHLQRRPYGMKLLAYTLINVRRFCAIENLQPLIHEWFSPPGRGSVMAKPYRTRHVGCALSEEEYRQLRAICAALRLTTREVLMMGVHRARARLAEERRRQPEQ
jgi:hypothetical protein